MVNVKTMHEAPCPGLYRQPDCRMVPVCLTAGLLRQSFYAPEGAAGKRVDDTEYGDF
ncbi:MAG: hypothetical protein J5871_02585 [Bacteroidales bacterium]|nr:hypothetical protein [Bacteroidales bacterium]